MSIRRKIIIIVATTFLILFLLVYLLSRTLLIQGFSDVEAQEMRERTKSGVQSLTNIITDLATKVHDWSAWDDTYKFILDKNKAYIESNLNTSSLNDLNINFIIFTDTQGKVVMSKSAQLNTLQEIPLPNGLLPYLTKDSPLLQLPDVESVKEGIILLPEGPLMVAARPITTSQSQGPIRGAVIFGRFLDDSIVKRLSITTTLPVEIQRYDDQALPDDFQKAKNLMKADEIVTFPLNTQYISGYSVINDINNRPGLLFKITDSRSVFLQGEKTIYVYLSLIGGISALVCLIILLLLDWFVSSRIAKLSTIISASKARKHLELPGNDEFSRLANLINTMTDDLKKFLKEIQTEEQNTEQERAKLDTLVKNLPVGVYLADASTGKGLMMNETGTEIFGKVLDASATAETFSDVYNLITEDNKPYPSSLLPLALTIKNGKPVSKSDVYVKKDNGTKIALRLSSVPINDSVTGQMIAVLAVFEDMTKEKEVDRMKSEFISLASHQLRTPIAAMKWLLEIMIKGKAGDLKPKQKEILETINKSNEHLIELVNALLNISRIESGRLIISPKLADLKTVVNDVLTELKQKISEKHQILSVKIPDTLPQMKLDVQLLRQVYINLLTNAIKYTPQGGIIRVTITEKDEQIISQIKDTGYGIPAKDHDKVFQKFYRGDNVVKRETEGTGLGLYLVKTIIDSSGGNIWFETQKGKGTSFWFSIPSKGMTAKKGEVTLNS